jgi:hypothetical protein
MRTTNAVLAGLAALTLGALWMPAKANPGC